MSDETESLTDAFILAKELRDRTCRCGKPKRTNNTFCRQCFYSLPLGKRMDLYQPIGGGYAEARVAAVALLDAAATDADADAPDAG